MKVMVLGVWPKRRMDLRYVSVFISLPGELRLIFLVQASYVPLALHFLSNVEQ